MEAQNDAYSTAFKQLYGYHLLSKNVCAHGEKKMIIFLIKICLFLGLTYTNKFHKNLFNSDTKCIFF